MQKDFNKLTIEQDEMDILCKKLFIKKTGEISKIWSKLPNDDTKYLTYNSIIVSLFIIESDSITNLFHRQITNNVFFFTQVDTALGDFLCFHYWKMILKMDECEFAIRRRKKNKISLCASQYLIYVATVLVISISSIVYHV
jgi:hypothetical protein